MIGDHAYFMGRAAARAGGPQSCPFEAETMQGRSWRRGWREVAGAEYVPMQPVRAWEEKAHDLLARLEALPRRGGSITSKVVYWQIAEDYDVITLMRGGLEPAQIAERLGRSPYAIYDRIDRLRAHGFGLDMEPDRKAA